MIRRDKMATRASKCIVIGEVIDGISNSIMSGNATVVTKTKIIIIILVVIVVVVIISIGIQVQRAQNQSRAHRCPRGFKRLFDANKQEQFVST